MARTVWRAVEKYFLLNTGTFEECARSVRSTMGAVNEAFERFPIWRKCFEFWTDGQKYHFVAKPIWLSNPNNYCRHFSDEEVKQLRVQTQKLWQTRRRRYVTSGTGLNDNQAGQAPEDYRRAKKATLEALKAAMREHKAALQMLNSRGEARIRSTKPK